MKTFVILVAALLCACQVQAADWPVFTSSEIQNDFDGCVARGAAAADAASFEAQADEMLAVSAINAGGNPWYLRGAVIVHSPTPQWYTAAQSQYLEASLLLARGEKMRALNAYYFAWSGFTKVSAMSRAATRWAAAAQRFP